MRRKHLYVCCALLLTALLPNPFFYTLGQAEGQNIHSKGSHEKDGINFLDHP